MEMDSKEAGGEANVLLEGILQVVPNNELQLWAAGLVEAP